MLPRVLLLTRDEGVALTVAAWGCCRPVRVERFEPDEESVLVVADEAVRRAYPKLASPASVLRDDSAPAVRNACIVTYSAGASQALQLELRAVLRALRCTREPLFVLAVRTAEGAVRGTAEDKWPEADLHMQSGEGGYDIFPFAWALALLRTAPLGTALGPFVTKIHSKSDDRWRRSLLLSAYIRPRQEADLLISRACCAAFRADARDPNTDAWKKLYEQGLVRRPPSPCIFAAGSVFTARRSLLHEASAWSDDARWAQALTPLGEMRQGRDGQTEHALERYLGLLCSERGRVWKV
jgi:hypothetical protein